jgi:hypothetical protein
MLSNLLTSALERLGAAGVSLRYGRMGADGSAVVIPAGLVDSVHVKGHHAKFMFEDARRALITSFNLLSFRWRIE